MSLFKKKKVLEPAEERKLQVREGYHIEINNVISTPDCMIVRCTVCFPTSDAPSIQVDVKDAAGNLISSKCVLLGVGESAQEVNGAPVFQKQVFSVFVNYTSSDFLFTVRRVDDSQCVHEQLFSNETIENKRATMDAVLYTNIQTNACYPEWFNAHRASKTELEMQRKSELKHKPKFSIGVPLWKTPLYLLNDLVNSIKAQTYSNWELILVNASLEDEELMKAVDSFCEQDERIRQIKIDHNDGLTLNRSYAVDVSEGDYICFMDHDDVLEPNCLYEYAKVVNENPDADLIYCDEDLLFPDGHYGGVFFKPEFSLHLLRSVNYVCHMLCIRRSLVNTLNYKQSEYDGAEDHNLTLQAAEKTTSIYHIPKVLYHWRVIETSVAGNPSSKSYGKQSGVNAIAAHLKRLGIDAEVSAEENMLFSAKVKYAIPESNPRVSIVVSVPDDLSMLAECVNSVLERTAYSNYEIVVVVNETQRGTFHQLVNLPQDSRIKVVFTNCSNNAAEMNNFGRKKATGDYLVFLESSVKIITSNWLEVMLGVCSQSDVGVVGCKLLNCDDTIQQAGIVIGNKPYGAFSDLPNHQKTYLEYAYRQKEVSAVSAACLMTKAQVFDDALGFDDKFQIQYADVDFSFKVRDLGLLAIYTPHVEAYNCRFLDANRSIDQKQRAEAALDGARLVEEWPELMLRPDPYCSANLERDEGLRYFNF